MPAEPPDGEPPRWWAPVVYVLFALSWLCLLGLLWVFASLGGSP